MRQRVYRSVKALYGAANTLYWKSSGGQNFTHLTILKHQNTKTSIYKLSKNHWVIALFDIFGSVSKKLQSTVFNDHPVVVAKTIYVLFLLRNDSRTSSGKLGRVEICHPESLDFLGLWKQLLKLLKILKMEKNPHFLPYLLEYGQR